MLGSFFPVNFSASVVIHRSPFCDKAESDGQHRLLLVCTLSTSVNRDQVLGKLHGAIASPLIGVKGFPRCKVVIKFQPKPPTQLVSTTTGAAILSSWSAHAGIAGGISTVYVLLFVFAHERLKGKGLVSPWLTFNI